MALTLRLTLVAADTDWLNLDIDIRLIR